MSYRRTPFVPDEYYHIYNRGNNKETIFHNERDYIRYMFLLLYCQSHHVIFNNIGRHVTFFEKRGRFNIAQSVYEEIINSREVAIISFCLMPNHFHIQIKEIKDGGISSYMQRIQTAFARYYNEKYKDKHVGHVFQGVFKSKHQNNNRQLLHTSAYIHRNCREISIWRGNERDYSWSSYGDYVGKNRWENLLQRNIILDQFKNAQEYEKYVYTSPAKELNSVEYEFPELIKSTTKDKVSYGNKI